MTCSPTFVERFCENPEEGYQRRFRQAPRRRDRGYLATDGMSIPINVVLSAQTDAELTYTRKTKQLTYQRVPEAFAVIDGQHRLWGYPLVQAAASRAGGHLQRARCDGGSAALCRHQHEAKRSPEGTPKERQSIAGTETEIEANLRRLFLFLNTSESSPLRGKLNVGESSPGKLSRISFDSTLRSRAEERPAEQAAA